MKILAFDIGTSSVRAAIYDPGVDWSREVVGQVALEVHRPEPGAARLEPKEVQAAADELFKKALAQLQASGEREVWVSAAAFWHSLLGLDAERKPVTPCWIWEDTEAEGAVGFMQDEHIGGLQATGCPISFVFWPTRIFWHRGRFKKEHAKVAHWVSLPDVVLEGLGLLETGVTSLSMASGTGLVRRAKGTWAAEVMNRIPMELQALPRIDNKLTERSIGGIGFKTLPPIGDGAAGTLGSGVSPEKDTLALNFGTSAAVRGMCSQAAERVPPGLFEYRLDAGRWILGGAVNNAGNLFEWARETLRVSENPAELEVALAARPGPITNLTVLPFFAGERTPYWRGDLTGSFVGLTFKHSALDILQASQEATFYALREIAELLDPTGVCEVVVSGGLTRSPASLQRLSHILARPVVVLEEQEVSLFGAVLFAAEWAGLEAPEGRRGRVYLPEPELVKRFDQVRKGHLEAAGRYVQGMGSD